MIRSAEKLFCIRVSYCVDFKAMRYDSTSMNKNVAEKPQYNISHAASSSQALYRCEILSKGRPSDI